MNEIHLLGQPVEVAVARLRQEGYEPVIIRTAAPGKEEREGTERVVRVRGCELTTARFPDGTPE